MLFPCPRSRLRICWSREKRRARQSRPAFTSLLISILRLNLVHTYGILPDFRGGVHLFIYINSVDVVVCCCFSHSAYWLPTRKKLLYTVANPARGLLNREKRTKEKVWKQPPPPPTLLVRRKINKITRRIYRRYAGLGRSRVRTRIPSARRLGQWVWLRKIPHSRLR